jgi:hypothetical protein
MKNTKNFLILAALVVVIGGCGGMLGKTAVPNEQINADLNGKKVKVTEGSYSSDNEWFFRKDYERCFVVNDSESKISDTEANLSVTVSSWGDLKLGDLGMKNEYITVFGKLAMQYKKEGEKWVLQNLESKELIFKSLDTEQWKKFLEISMPNCTKGFRHTGL